MAPSGSAAKAKGNNKNKHTKNDVQKARNSQNGSKNGSARNTKTASSVAPLWLQQAILDVFATSFGPHDANELRERIQKVKGCLYNRDFIGAFESEENQEAYCLRWSPSRAIAYTELLCDVPEIFSFLQGRVRKPLSGAHGSGQERIHGGIIACIGGGAGAEAVAFAAAMEHSGRERLREAPEDGMQNKSAATSQPEAVTLNVIDIASWRSVLQKLSHGVQSVMPQAHPGNSTQSSELSLRGSPEIVNSFLPQLSIHEKTDVLQLPASELARLVSVPDHPNLPTLITILFTLNELYSTSMPATTSFLLALTSLTGSGTLLLVVDSPGSYSTVKLGETEKKYPMQWMLDHTLLNQAAKIGNEGDAAAVPKWKKVDSEESRWWRMDRDRLRYMVPGVELEDMRMQWHLFERV